jgi:hypothetical protein
MQAPGRCFLTTCLSAALIAASMLCAMPARAQGDTPKPDTAPPSTQPAPSSKSLTDLKPKSIDADIDPCKLKKPPAYCGKR